MEVYFIILLILLIIGIIIFIVWLAYSVTAAYQQTLTINVPFEETYRHVPKLSQTKKWKLDSIKVKVTGSIKKDKELKSTIILGQLIEDMVKDNIIIPYQNCLLIQEANIFNIDENIIQVGDNTLRRCPLVKNPTVENLSIMFFNKLSKLTTAIGCQLVSVKLESEGLKVIHSRYKISDYTV